MMRLSPWVCLLTLAVLGLWVPDCEARGGGGRGGGGFSRAEFEQVDVPAVEFTENIPAATEAAVKEDKPFLVFFSFFYVPIWYYMCVAEERDLLIRYGAAYEEYRSKTGFWLPKRNQK